MTSRILLVEDDVDMLKTLECALQQWGYEVTAVTSGMEAVALGSEHEFDLVITDLRMPGMDGLEALEQVQLSNPTMQSLVVTGFSSEADTVRALRLGVGEYLNKPFRLDQFRIAVDKLAAQERQARAQADLAQRLRRVSIFGLEAWVGEVGVKAGQLAFKMAAELELDEGRAETLQIACLRSLSHQLRPLPTRFEEALPAEARLAQEGLAAEVLTVSLALAQGGSLPPEVSPRVQAASAGVAGDETPAWPQKRRSLLSLAQALEQSRDYKGAVRAYQELVAQPASRESAAAALGLARLARLWGHVEQVREFALRATELAGELGPLALAEVIGDSGALLAYARSGRADDVLARASALYQELQFQAREAHAELARLWLQGAEGAEGPLARLLEADQEGILVASGWWLAPWLLEKGGARASQALRLLLAQSPGTFASCLNFATLSSEALMRLLSLDPPPATLERIARLGQPDAREKALQLLGQERKRANPAVRVYSLGSLEVFLGETRVEEESWRPNQKARYLLSYLALQPGRPASDDVLSELFWPQEEAKGRVNLASVRSILRRCLQTDQPGLEVLQRTPQGTLLNPEVPVWHDAEELRTALEGARRAPVSESLGLLRRACQLYRGPFLESCYLDWAVRLREQLESGVLHVLLTLAEWEGAHQSWEASLECSQRAVDIDETSQEGTRLAMQSLMKLGRASEALKVFERCGRSLKKDGAEPSIQLLEMFHRARLEL